LALSCLIVRSRFPRSGPLPGSGRRGSGHDVIRVRLFRREHRVPGAGGARGAGGPGPVRCGRPWLLRRCGSEVVARARREI